MATHVESARKKALLVQDLRAQCGSGAMVPGQMLPTLGQLTARYGLSNGVVHQVLKELVSEGLLYTIPRVGIFVGQKQADTNKPFLLVARKPRAQHVYVAMLQSGFEEKVAQMGGVSHAIHHTDLETITGQGSPEPAISGIFGFGLDTLPLHGTWAGATVPQVTFGKLEKTGPMADQVDFDNVDGGQQATRHLLGMGHRKIAFFGMHDAAEVGGTYYWSEERGSGWKTMLSSAGQPTADLTFLPQTNVGSTFERNRAALWPVATRLVQRADVTAVVAANATVVQVLLACLQSQNVPPTEWPAIVGFDQTPTVTATGVSYLRLPWEKIGAEAASLLMDRQSGSYSGVPRSRLVKMRLIPRLSCRANWVTASGFGPYLVPGTPVEALI